MASIVDIFGQLISPPLDKWFGTKPVVPEPPKLTDAQTQSIQANIANLGDIAKLATGANTLNQDQLEALIDRALGPGVRQQIQSNLASGLRGEVPQDVRNAIYRSNAERGVGPFQNARFREYVNARDIGRTSLDIMDKNLSSAESWLQGAMAPPMDITRAFISPEAQYQSNLEKYQRDMMVAKIAAAPDPGARGVYDTTMTMAGMVTGIMGGGTGYQGSYNPASAYGSAPTGPNYGGNVGYGGGPSAANGGWYFGGNQWGFGRSGTGQWYMGTGPGPG